MTADPEILEAALGYSFRDREPLVRALTHKSRTHEQTRPGEDPVSNEQLEFLGDAILGLVVSDFLFRNFPGYGEGRLSKLKAHLVSEARLYEVAQALSLGGYLLLGRGEEMSGGREKRALLGDAVEALIAALYLDGGLPAARQFIESQIVGSAGLEDQTGEFTTVDYKSALQERAQALHMPQPKYAIVEESGPEHSKVFTVEARIGREWTDRAQGTTKKAAGQNAARLLLDRLPEAER